MAKSAQGASAVQSTKAKASTPVSALGRSVKEVPASTVKAKANAKAPAAAAAPKPASEKAAKPKAGQSKPVSALGRTVKEVPAAEVRAKAKPKAAKREAIAPTVNGKTAAVAKPKSKTSTPVSALGRSVKDVPADAIRAVKKPAKAASPTESKVAAEKTKSAEPAPSVVAKDKERPASVAAARPWLDSYPPNISRELGAPKFQSIGDMLVDACKRYAARPAFTCMGKTMSFDEVEKASAAFGAFLQAKGLAKGARVALMMPNILQYPIAMMGVLRAGYTVVNVNPLYTPRELEHQLKDSGAEAIVILENFAKTLQAVAGKTKVKHVVVASMGDMMGLKGIVVNLVVRRVKKMVPAWSLPGHIPFKSALSQGRSATLKAVKLSGDDVAFLQYTGGTTGVSKGATLLHRNVLANVAQNEIWVESAYLRKPKPERLTYVCALPLYHIFALTVNALMGMQLGAHNVLIPNPRDIPAFVGELKKYPVNIFPGLNTLFNALLNNEEFKKLDFKPLLLTLGGGMAVQEPVAERWKKLTGCMIAEGYGLSETAPVATANRFDSEKFTGTIGLPIPGTEIAILDDDANEVALGEVGEIAIRGPQVMAGYWNRPDETAKVMTADGWFKSGDMGFMDAKGYTKIVDRKKDMILVSGFNVYPNEIEEVIAKHPGVLESAAIGVPDEKSGEVPKLFVVKKDPSLTEEDIRKFCRENLTGYKLPRYIEFRAELPKTPVGKILRRELRG